VTTVIHASVHITATNISSCQLIESKWCHHIHANFFADKQTCNLHPMSGITSSWGIRGKGEVLASKSGCRAAINRFYSLRPTSETSVSSRMRNTKISRYLVEASRIRNEEKLYPIISTIWEINLYCHFYVNRK